MNDRFWPRAVALVAVLALGIGGAACGAGDDDAGGGAAQASGGADERRGPHEPTSPDESEIHALYGKLQKALYGGDPKAACSYMTVELRQTVAASQKKSCAAVMESAISEGFSKKKARIYRLEVNGDEAVARAGTATSNKYPVEFAKLNGEWKISGGY